MNDVRIRAGLWLLAIGALAPTAFVSLSGDTGAEVTSGLVDNAVRLQLGGIIATFVAAGLIAAAVSLGRTLPGLSGAVVGVAGTAVAVFYGAYYATFAAAAVVGNQMLEEPGAGLGEGSLLALNLVEIARYAPTLALVVAAVAARRSLSKPVWVFAAVLAVATVFPMTTWAAAIVAPAWLAVAAAGAGARTMAAEPVLTH